MLEKLLERFVASEFLETSPEWIGLHPRLFDGELGSLELGTSCDPDRQLQTSAMTRRAVDKLFHLDVIIPHKFLAHGELIAGRCIRLPVHHEHRLAGTYVTFRIAVALQAPFHGQRLLFPGQRHLVNPPVARHTGDPFLNVDSMVEVDEIG